MPHLQVIEVSPAHPTTAAEVKLGNIWLIAATMATSVLREAEEATGQPALLLVDENGEMRAIGPEHPDYAESMNADGFACAATSKMSILRMAYRLREAALRGATRQ